MALQSAAVAGSQGALRTMWETEKPGRAGSYLSSTSESWDADHTPNAFCGPYWILDDDILAFANEEEANFPVTQSL